MLVPPLLVPPLLVPPLLVPPLLVQPLLHVQALVPPLLRLQPSGAGSAAASSSGTGSDGATSTASRLAIFWNAIGNVFFARCGGYKKAQELTRAGHRIVQSTLLLSFFAAPEAYKRTFIRRIHHNQTQ